VHAVKRIVFATFGSLGDIYPYIALALELKRRGHHPVIATSDVHRTAIEAERIDYAPMRPHAADLGDPAELVGKLLHPTQGPRYLIREIMMPHVRGAYEDLDRACSGADVLVTHPLAFAGRIVAEKRALAWRSTVLSPLSLMSVYDPPFFSVAPWLIVVRRLGIAPYRGVFAMLKRVVGSWEKPLHDLRAELGLPSMRSFAQFEGQFAPAGTLALFSRLLAQPQPDWPPHTDLCGFARYDGPAPASFVRDQLEHWLAAGPPPIVFTLGSSVSMSPTGFFAIALAAARTLRMRALLITGQDAAAIDAQARNSGIGSSVRAFDYLPYSDVFPHAAAIVHQAGIGTLAQALASGKPQVIVPVSFDQPDNARRAVLLGVGLDIPFRKVDAPALTSALRAVIESPRYAEKAAAVARMVRAEQDEHSAAAMLPA
jgi:rhamnosyltransferase subunit B